MFENKIYNKNKIIQILNYMLQKQGGIKSHYHSLSMIYIAMFSALYFITQGVFILILFLSLFYASYSRIFPLTKKES